MTISPQEAKTCVAMIIGQKTIGQMNICPKEAKKNLGYGCSAIDNWPNDKQPKPMKMPNGIVIIKAFRWQH